MLADGTEYPYEGLYDYTRKDVSSTTGTLVLVVMFPNPDRSLKPGQFARVEGQPSAPGTGRAWSCRRVREPGAGRQFGLGGTPRAHGR